MNPKHLLKLIESTPNNTIEVCKRKYYPLIQREACADCNLTVYESRCAGYIPLQIKTVLREELT